MFRIRNFFRRSMPSGDASPASNVLTSNPAASSSADQKHVEERASHKRTFSYKPIGRRSGCSSADKSDEANSDYLDGFIQNKRSRLWSTRCHTGQHFIGAENGPVQSATSADDLRPVAKAEIWALHLSQLPRDFFKSAEARLDDQGENRSSLSLRKGYTALRLFEDLNPDLNTYRETSEISSLLRNQHIASYTMFKVTLGQLARYACSVNRADPTKFSRDGYLFQLSTDEKLNKAFIVALQTKCAASTVAGKAASLRKWASCAAIYYGKRGDNSKENCCKETEHFMRVTASSEKREARRDTRIGQDPEKRLSERKIIVEEDYEDAKRVASDALEGICASLRGIFVKTGAVTESSRHRACFKLLATENYALLQKWCLNFCALISLCGGGQRAQTYAQMQLEALALDDDGNFIEWGLNRNRECFENQHIFFNTISEKTRRSMRMPYVRLPSSILTYYEFHRNYIRPVVLKRAGAAEQPGHVKLLLLHSGTAKPLTALQVSKSIKCFFQNCDEELDFVTPLVLRRSFATMMYRKYIRGAVYKSKSRQEFLDDLAQAMNTSREQLEQVYLSLESAEALMGRLSELHDADSSLQSQASEE